MHRLARQALLIGSIAAMVAACGGNTPPASSTAGGGTVPGSGSPASTGGAALTIDSCQLLSDAEIDAATGQAVTTRKASTLTQVFSSVCDIELDGGGKLTVSVLPTGGKRMYERSFEPFIGQSEVLDEAVPGLGDKAARAGDDDLMVLVGDTLFDVFYIEFGRDDKLPKVRYLADVVVAKLPCIATGCSGFTAPPPPPTTAAIDVCGLLTEEEVAAAASLPVASEASTEPLSCTWTLQSGSYAGAHYVTLWLVTPGGRESFDRLANDTFDVDPEHVPGIGDDAVKMGTVPAGSMYSVLGDRMLRLEFSMPLEVADPYGPLAPLLKSAVSRL